MLKSFAGGAEHIVLATGATDFRKQITSISSMVTMQYHMDRFARQEKDFYQMGLEISRANMSHWTIRCSDEWLMPVYNRIHQILIQKCEILHMDETRIQVNKESGKKASSDSFMWVLQSGACGEIKATFFHYSRTRSQKVALELIDGFKGYLTTDAYAAYASMHLENEQISNIE